MGPDTNLWYDNFHKTILMTWPRIVASEWGDKDVYLENWKFGMSVNYPADCDSISFNDIICTFTTLLTSPFKIEFRLNDPLKEFKSL